METDIETGERSVRSSPSEFKNKVDVSCKAVEINQLTKIKAVIDVVEKALGGGIFGRRTV